MGRQAPLRVVHGAEGGITRPRRSDVGRAIRQAQALARPPLGEKSVVVWKQHSCFAGLQRGRASLYFGK
jgi:hypothetical protein